MFNDLFEGWFVYWVTFCHATKNKPKECCENVRLHIPGFILTCFGCFISITPGPLVGSSLYTDLQFALFLCKINCAGPTLLHPLEQECQAIMLCKQLCFPHRARPCGVEQAWVPASLETKIGESQVQVLLGLQIEFKARPCLEMKN